jgi:hypothetical protein
MQIIISTYGPEMRAPSSYVYFDRYKLDGTEMRKLNLKREGREVPFSRCDFALSLLFL